MHFNLILFAPSGFVQYEAQYVCPLKTLALLKQQNFMKNGTFQGLFYFEIANISTFSFNLFILLQSNTSLISVYNIIQY